MGDLSSPIQKGRSTYQSMDGRVVDRQLVLLSNLLPGNIEDAIKTMPQVGTPHPEGLNAPLFSKAVVEVMDGSKSYGQLTYDNRGNGGWFTGQLKKTSRTLESVMEKHSVPKVYLAANTNGVVVQKFDTIEIDRATKQRVETRIVRDAQGIDNILSAIDSQTGKMWFKPSGNYVFVDGVINDSGGGQGEYRVDYLFKLYSAMEPNPAGNFASLAGYISIPALASGEMYYPLFDTKGKIVSVGTKWIGDTRGQTLRLPGL